MFSILGMRMCGERTSGEEAAFNYWLMIHSPELLTEEGRKSLADNIPVENLRDIKRFTKREFFDVFLAAMRLCFGRASPA